MSLKIFESDEPTAPTTDIVGRFRSGYQASGRPVPLSTWRVTAGDPAVLEQVGAILGVDTEQQGGDEPTPWETTGPDPWELFTTASTADIVLHDVRAEMVLWGQGGKPVRTCDGATQGNEQATPCVCPTDLRERKAAARDGWGCKPNITLRFALAGLEHAGLFRFSTGSWDFAAAIGRVEEALSLMGTSPYRLGLEEVKFTTKAGAKVQYHKPVLSLLPELLEPADA